MTGANSLDASYFDGIFDSDDDPWSLSSSNYETAKFEHSVRALEGRRHASALEVGCAQGELTRRLAPFCDQVLAVDIASRAIARASARNGGLRNVRFQQADFPREPNVSIMFDLIILSEVVYYWSDSDLLLAAAWLRRHLVRDGRILLVHWTGETDYPQTGDGAITKLRAALANTITVERAERADKYRLDLWTRQ